MSEKEVLVEVKDGVMVITMNRPEAENAANGPLAVAASKAVINKTHDWTAQEMFFEQARVIDPVFSSEGATAFAEKRSPVWKGK